MVTRSSSSDMFAVFLGGVSSGGVGGGGRVLAGEAMIWYAIGQLKVVEEEAGSGPCEQPSFNWQLRLRLETTTASHKSKSL